MGISQETEAVLHETEELSAREFSAREFGQSN